MSAFTRWGRSKKRYLCIMGNVVFSEVLFWGSWPMPCTKIEDGLASAVTLVTIFYLIWFFNPLLCNTKVLECAFWKLRSSTAGPMKTYKRTCGRDEKKVVSNESSPQNAIPWRGMDVMNGLVLVCVYVCVGFQMTCSSLHFPGSSPQLLDPLKRSVPSLSPAGRCLRIPPC